MVPPASYRGGVRKLRPPIPGGFFHVTSRAVDGRMILVETLEQAIFYTYFAQATSRYDWCCLSYCLMGTHYHGVLETPQGNLSAGMKFLNERYAQGYNKRHGRRGHLFESRFSSTHIQTDEHLREAIRYTELNPVRAGLCHSPAEWPCSSYSAIMGLAPAPSFLDVGRTLALFGRNPERARAAFRAFVLAPLAEE